jgi:mevalonate kinase
VGEMCIHGNPSGVDNTVSAGGKAVLFQRKDYAKPPLVKPLRDFPELPLLLVNTRQSRSTANEVAKVATLKKGHPEIAEHILSAIDQVTRSAHDLITQEDFDPDDPSNLKYLGELITVNHGLLVSLGVSHPKLERIRALIDHAGIGWTKLTGAGGGGCAITILKPESIESDSPVTATTSALPRRFSNNDQSSGGGPAKKHKSKRLIDLQQRLKAEGFELFETTLAGDGVGVLWPAVIQNASREAGGEEIDQEKFLKAVGNEGIEALVGVHQATAGQGGDGEREGWRFWRPKS